MTSDGTMTERQRRSSSITVDEHYKGPTGAVRKVCGQVTAVGKMDHEAKAFEKEIRNKNVVQLQVILLLYHSSFSGFFPIKKSIIRIMYHYISSRNRVLV